MERDLSNTDLSAQTQNVIVDSIRCLPEFAADVSDPEKEAEIAKLRGQLAKVCEAGEVLMRDVDKHSTGAFLSADDLQAAIAAARKEVGEK